MVDYYIKQFPEDATPGEPDQREVKKQFEKLLEPEEYNKKLKKAMEDDRKREKSQGINRDKSSDDVSDENEGGAFQGTLGPIAQKLEDS